MKRTSQLKKLARHLLATTCLTATTALATTISEPPNFGTTFATATSLPEGTTEVEGSLLFPADTNDYFIFQDLEAGTEFNFTASTTSSFTLGVNLLTSGDAAFPGAANPYVFTMSDPNIVTGITAPSDGQIVFDVVTGGGEGPARPYTITVNSVTYGPEPGTLGAMGLGLAAGALTLRRRKKT